MDAPPPPRYDSGYDNLYGLRGAVGRAGREREDILTRHRAIAAINL